MAAGNSLLKLKVDSSEYDANIKKAAEGIQHLAKRMHDAQGEFEGLDKDSLEFIKNLQYMTTSAKTASGQYRELENAYKNLAATYEGLNAFEKQGDAGKALAEQLEILKTRTLDMKANMDAATQSLQDNTQATSSDTKGLESLTSALGINIKSLVGWGTALGAGKIALDVMKDAFFANEEQLDSWNSMVESSESVYNGFLNALNTGDISGYINNINDIVKAATAAYNALDALNTFNAFNQINVEKSRTSMTESIVDYREGKISKEDVKAAGDAYKKELKERQRLEKEAYIEAIGKVAAERGVSKQDLIDALSGTYGHYQDLKKTELTGTVTEYSPGIMPGTQGSYTTYKVAANAQERFGEALRQLNDTELQSLQALGAQAERTGNEIAQIDRQLVRVLNSKSGTDSIKPTKTDKKEIQDTSGSVAELAKELKSLQQAQQQSTNPQQWESYQKQIEEVIKKVKELKGELPNLELGGMPKIEAVGIASQYMKDVTLPTRDSIIAKGQAAIKNFKGTDSKEKKTEVSLTKELGQITAGVSGIFSGIESLGIELPQGMKDVVSGIQGVMSILTGIASIVSAIQAISAADILKPFAHGGIVPHAANGYFVPGNNFSGDTTPILANAGELVLNKSSQNNLASMITEAESRGRGGNGLARVSGEQIWIAVNAYTKRSGKGELVTWK